MHYFRSWIHIHPSSQYASLSVKGRHPCIIFDPGSISIHHPNMHLYQGKVHVHASIPDMDPFRQINHIHALSSIVHAHLCIIIHSGPISMHHPNMHLYRLKVDIYALLSILDPYPSIINHPSSIIPICIFIRERSMSMHPSLIWILFGK